MLRRYAVAVVTGLFLASNAFAGATDDVKKTVDEVVHVVSDKNLKKHDQQRRQALKKTISVIFDYSEMAKRSLGKHWSQRSQAERRQFTDLFASLLENSYAGKIESYNNEKIMYLKETVDGDHAEVRSKVITPKRDEYSLDYRLLKENGKWMVYDVVIEGVSLVSNYRTQFNKIITTNGYNELVKKLKTKTDELKAP
ncbi:ABC transporter substrate-binding protein [Oryzomonas sagensis]|uniref:ABC transporter substrate-binding protein n=1 Tax=Oryzomonas sagensis TaxID=2603857 RepID=A0ABQ6TT90_9BACT|nr:ABC transporter substrate-binding protein [Oryzomonas sagensis]KAB0671937.1 ABC transporter substrate-binding protein [Oryzomonas sagensis]